MAVQITKLQNSAGKMINNITNGIAKVSNLALNDILDVGISSSDIILKPNPTSLNDIYQEVTIPADYDGSDITLNWFRYKNYADVKLWRKMQAVIAENRANGHITNYDTITNFNNNYFSLGKPVQLPNGKIFCPKFGVANSVIFDPYTLTETRVNDDGLTTKYLTAVLVNDHQVLCVAYDAVAHILYDFIADTYEYVPRMTGPFNHARLFDAGVICNPISWNTEIIDYISKIGVSRSSANSTNATFGIMSIPPDNILLIPYNDAGFVLVKLNETLNTVLLSQNGNTKYRGGILLEDESIYCVGYLNDAHIFDLKSLTLRPLGLTTASLNQFGSLLNDGRVITGMCSRTAPGFYIDDPMATENIRTVINYNATAYSDQSFSGTLLLADGRIFVSPNNAPGPKLISASDGNYGVLPDIETLCSAYLN